MLSAVMTPGAQPAPIPPRLVLRGITKRYPTTVACDGVDLEVRAGEIHALLGENGAGKSTLMKIVYGLVRPDAGHLEWEGRPVTLSSPAQARRLGVGMVFQHFSLLETLTVAENISLALQRPVPPAALAARIEETSRVHGLPVDPQRLVHGMSVGERQRVEIVRCLLESPRLVILDEPTAVLTPQAAEQLFASLRRLAAAGVSILYISHKLAEIRALCDRATVLRGGRVVGRVVPRDETPDSLARLMVGREVQACQLTSHAPGEPLLTVAGLSVEKDDPSGTRLEDLHLTVHAGEIVGIAGVSGNGQKELLAALSGERQRITGGSLCICGEEARHLGPAARRALGLAYVPEDRLGRGAVPALSLARNALLTGARAGLVRAGLIREAAARDFARRTIQLFDVRGGDERSPAGSLSGGNLQKFIVGRELLLAPRLLIVAQPTWGVDVAASQLIRQALLEQRARDVAVLVVSEDLDELLMICDRIAVLASGRLSTAMPRATVTAERLGTLMAGAALQETADVPAPEAGAHA
jgi:simple sugar transport system ATP-binding protein